MAKWMSYLAYDCMGEIVFGKGFGMLTDPSLRYILELMDMTVYSYLLVTAPLLTGLTPTPRLADVWKGRLPPIIA